MTLGANGTWPPTERSLKTTEVMGHADDPSPFDVLFGFLPLVHYDSRLVPGLQILALITDHKWTYESKSTTFYALDNIVRV